VGFVQANAQSRAQRQVYRATSAQAEQAADLELRGIRTRQLQERASASQTIQAIALEALQRRGTARVAALEAGVGGQAATLIDRDFTQQGLNQIFGVESNLVFLEDQLEREAVAARQRQYGRTLGSLPTSPAPSILEPFLGVALSIAETGLYAPEAAPPAGGEG